MSNGSNQPRNLKPSGPSPNAYSASPSQLTLTADPQSLANPYSSFSFPGQEPSPYGYAQHYRPPPLQTQLAQAGHPQQAGGPQPSPNLSRKRRNSDIDNLGGPSNAFMPAMDGQQGQQDGGIVHQQQPVQAPQAANQAQATSPAVKKGRTNTPWTPAEEQRLKSMRDAGSSWSDIAKMFPMRTEGSVKKHWYKDMHYAEFAEDESAALMQAIKEYENNKWKTIGQKLGKPAKACEQFAKDQGWKV